MKILPNAAVIKRHPCMSIYKVAVIIQRNYFALRKTLPRNDGGVWQEKLSTDWHQSWLSVASLPIMCSLQRVCQNRSLTLRWHADGGRWRWLMGWAASIWDCKEQIAIAECFQGRVILCDPSINSLMQKVCSEKEGRHPVAWCSMCVSLSLLFSRETKSLGWPKTDLKYSKSLQR